jgi:hypothetical protein
LVSINIDIITSEFLIRILSKIDTFAKKNYIDTTPYVVSCHGTVV